MADYRYDAAIVCQLQLGSTDCGCDGMQNVPFLFYLFRPVHTLAVNSEPYLTILCTDIRGKARTIQSPAIFLYSIPNFFIKSEFVGLIVTYTVFDLSNFVTLGKFVLHRKVLKVR